MQPFETGAGPTTERGRTLGRGHCNRGGIGGGGQPAVAALLERLGAEPVQLGLEPAGAPGAHGREAGVGVPECVVGPPIGQIDVGGQGAQDMLPGVGPPGAEHFGRGDECLTGA